MKRLCILAGLLFACMNLAFAQTSNFTKGEELFRKNKPDEAIPYLEEAISKGESPKAYVYLVVAYYQIGHYEESLSIADRGMRVTGSNKKVIAYNAGNAAFLMQDYKTAEEWYTKALVADPSYANAVLNRANARISLEKYSDCIEDYTKFLELAPDDYRREDILALLEKLKRVQVEQEQQKAAQEAEQAKIKEEEERYQAELIRQAAAEAERRYQEQAAQAAAAQAAADEAAERRKKLLEDVAASLQDSSTENMSAGAEGTVDYDYESELE